MRLIERSNERLADGPLLTSVGGTERLRVVVEGKLRVHGSNGIDLHLHGSVGRERLRVHARLDLIKVGTRGEKRTLVWNSGDVKGGRGGKGGEGEVRGGASEMHKGGMMRAVRQIRRQWAHNVQRHEFSGQS